MAVTSRKYDNLHFADGRVLKRVGLVAGGKNSGGSTEDRAHGMYQEEKKGEFFVKQPKDKKELFTELFAAQILKGFSQICSDLTSPFIVADSAKLSSDNSYVLIQKKAKFQELRQLTSPTSTSRNALSDAFSGTTSYPQVLQSISHKGLEESLFFSLLLGDYSVHSDNMVLIPQEDGSFLVARIDWGAALRMFGENDNTNLFNPAEYWGPTGWYKLYLTKNYFAFYQPIPDLFNRDIPAFCQKIKLNLGTNEATIKENLRKIILDAINNMPVDLLDKATQVEVAEYLKISAFASHDKTEFVACMTNILYQRMDSILKLGNENIMAIMAKAYEQREQALRSSYEKEVKDLQSKEATLDRRLAELKTQISEKEKEKKEAIAQLQAQTQTEQENHKRVTDLEESNNELEMMMNGLTQNKKDLLYEIRSLREEKQQLTANITALSRENSTLKTEAARNVQEDDKRMITIDQVEQSNNELGMMITRLTQNKKDLLDEIQSLREEKQQLTANITALSSENSTLKTEAARNVQTPNPVLVEEEKKNNISPPLLKANRCFKFSLFTTVATLGAGSALGALMVKGAAISLALLAGISSGGMFLVAIATIAGMYYSYTALKKAGLFSIKVHPTTSQSASEKNIPSFTRV